MNVHKLSGLCAVAIPAIFLMTPVRADQSDPTGFCQGVIPLQDTAGSNEGSAIVCGFNDAGYGTPTSQELISLLLNGNGVVPGYDTIATGYGFYGGYYCDQYMVTDGTLAMYAAVCVPYSS
jgi:hypothetical protein